MRSPSFWRPWMIIPFSMKQGVPANRRVSREGKPITFKANLLWQWGGNPEKRGVIEIKRQPSLGEPIRLPTRYSWNKWHHVLLAWEEEEVYLLIAALLASRHH